MMKIWKKDQVKYVKRVFEDESGDEISAPLVMSSNAGWYVGQLWKDDDGFVTPYARISTYFKTPEEAQTWLNERYKKTALLEYKNNLECLSQFACSENLNLIEALTDNLLAHLVEMEANL